MEKLAHSVNDAAREISVSPWTIRSWITKGKLQAVKLGRRVVIEHEELLRLLEKGRQPIKGDGE